MVEPSLVFLDYFGTIVFAISGCLVAAKKQTDILAFIILGLLTAVGGGTLRDVMIGRTPVFWLTDQSYILIIIATAFVMFIGMRHLERIRHYKSWLLWSDAIGIATFTIIGTHIALENEVGIVPSILLGVSTACFGGVLRDVLSNELTLIFRKDIYMTACILGSVVYIGFYMMNMPSIGVVTSFLSCFGLRAMAIRYKLQLPGHAYFEND